MDIETQISKDYNNLVDIAKTLTKNHYDLLHIVIEDVLIRKDTDKIKSVLENNLLSYYIYRAMLFQIYSKSSKFNKLYRNENSIYSEVEIDEEYEIDVDEKVKYILELVDKNFSWYEAKLFKLYYLYEFEFEIEDLSYDEIKKIRKMSFRRLSEKVKINYVSISKTVNFVMEGLKKIIEKDGKISM